MIDDTQDDLVLREQARNRQVLSRTLGKHGWKLGKVGLRAGGTVITYELVRLSDNRAVEESLLLSEMVMWNTHAEADQCTQAVAEGLPDIASLMLWVKLLSRVKYENQIQVEKDKVSP